MLFLENLKPLKIYKRPLFLPTVEGDKKKKSAIFLLTPNYESSKALMKSDLLINRLRFASYYIEKDLTYFISSKVMDKVEDVTETYVRNFSEVDFYHSLCEMSAADRNKLKDSSFGLPSKRKYPLHDKSHVKSAIKFFNYVDKEDEAELAKNLNKAINKFYGKEDRPKVGKNNRFSKYYHESTLLESNSFIDHKSDKDLYDWMIKNVEYKSNGIYDVNKIESEHCGDCHDQAGYIYYNLKKLGYKTGRLFMVEYSKWNTPGGKTHTACWYIKNNKYYWMETAWGDMTGIHECGDSLTSVKHLIEKNWSFSGKNDRLFVGTCSGVKDGMSLNEYVNHCTPEKEASNYYHKGRIINSESVEDISSVVNNLTIKSENRNDHRTGYKFYLNEDLVGSFDVGDSYKNNNRWLIDFKVEKKYRGQGYGKALCEYAIDNLAVDYLQVLKTNKVALNLYENLGFVEDSISEDNRYLYMKLNENLNYINSGSVDISNLNFVNTPDTATLTTSALIFDYAGRLLMEDHIKCGAWNFPGGKLNEGEDLSSALCREVHEELSIDITKYHINFDNTFYCEYPVGSGEYRWFKETNYTVDEYKGEIINAEPNKHRSLAWFDINDLIEGKYPLAVAAKCVVNSLKDNNRGSNIPPEYTTCTGYTSELETLRKLATPEVYNKVLSSLGLNTYYPKSEDYPHINFVASNRDTVEVTKDNAGTHIDVYVNSISNNRQAEDQYIMALKLMIVGLLKAYKTGLTDTIANSVAEFVLGIYDPNTTCPDLDDFISSGGTIKDYIDRNCVTKVYEAKTITADSLTGSLKYRTSTKNKIYIGKIRNKTSKLMDSIADSIKIDPPKAPQLPNSNSGSSSNDTSSDENSDEKISESILNSIENEAYIINGDYVTFFEDATNDPYLRKILYKERMVKRKEVILLLDRVKQDIPEIKYTYVDIDRYQKKNLFVDLYYYNQAFFKNNEFKLRRAYSLYKDLLDRLINDKRIKSAGYTRRTVFIPINDWHKNPSTRMWMYREDINPISIIYDLMVNNPQGLKSLFNGVEVLFFGNNNYFTLDLNDTANSKRNAIKFKNFITKINKGEEFDEEDIDMTQDTPTKDAIKTDIMDKIETSKGVDLTKAADKVKKEEEENKKKRKPQIVAAAKPNVVKAVKKSSTKPTKEEEPEADEDKVISKMTKNKAVKDDTSKEDEELQKAIVRSINVDVDGNTVSDTDDALDIMDDDEYLKDLITGLDSMKDDSVEINKARADRMSKLDRELLDKSLKGRSIREIIGDDTTKDPTRAVDIPKTKLEVASPNKEWEEVSYLNFDKTYDLEHDIVNAFNHFSTVSRPLAIRNIKAEDHSTSEDRLDLYTAEYEDYRGKRYTIKLDIPKIKNNRFLLRGNAKMLQTQFFNMPIIKTDEDVCQIVTNYKKIIISRYNTSSGKSLPNTARLIKCADKYKGNRVKFTGGDNSLVCSKYVLPIDYIDLASVFTKIETKDVIIYFNQDEIRKEYEIDDNLGVPYAYSKKSNEIAYYSKDDTTPIVDRIVGALMTGPDNVVYDDFWQTYCSMKAPARGMYTRAKIMGSEIPLVVVVAYHDGLSKILSKANINYRLTDKLTKDDRTDLYSDYIRFSDGYLIYHTDYNSSLLLNGLKDCDTLSHSITEIDDKNMYLEFLDNYGGRIKADGLENFYDCEIDPITKETLAYYKLPTEYISVLLYANYLLSDNKYIKHTDTSSRRARRFELIAAYTYQVLSEAYSTYANSIKHNRNSAAFTCKQSAVIDKILLDPTSSDYSVINMLNDIESSNAISTKGLSGLNADRSYSLDKRTYDESMLGIVGMSTGFSGNVGITRQATLDSAIQGSRGYVKDTKGDMSKMNAATALTATEAVVPFSVTHDDPFRTAMTFIQTSKHAVRTEVADPLLVTNGADEALPYMCSDQFAFKAKDDGVIKELTDSGMIVEYKNGEKEYINLTETIEKNSDGGFYVPLKLDADSKLKVGSKIKANQILAYDKYSLSNRAGETDNLAYNVGVLTKVAIINTDDGYEDSGVITELLAQKLIIKIIYKEDCILDKNTNIYNMIEVGSKVEQGDNLLVWQTPYDEEEVNNLLKALANDREALSELGKHTIKSEVTGTVVGIKMYRTVELDELSDSLKSAFKKYEKPISELKKKLKEEDIDANDLPANYPLDATGKLKKAQDSVLIEFYVEYEDIAGVGDKITYNAANKAVIKQVIPLGKEPYTDFRPKEPVTALVSSTSIARRMVVSTRIYGYLQKLMIELWRSCMDMAEIPYDESEL